jgi:hypothetical protein
MTNEELDQARVDEACRVIKDDARKNLLLEVARLAREGWTPPVAVDPDLAEAAVFETRYYAFEAIETLLLQAIKRGRELERAEAKPVMVWVKHDGKGPWPVQSDQDVCVKYASKAMDADQAANICWPNVTHYAIITQPEGAA